MPVRSRSSSSRVVSSFARWRDIREQTAAMGTYDHELNDWTYPGLDEKVAWWKQYWR